MRHNSRAFVDKLSFQTSLGHGPTGRERRALGVRTQGPTLLVTDLCMMKPDPDTNEFRVVSIHPGVTREQIVAATGWAVTFAEQVADTPAPTPVELDALRDLNARTAKAHGTTAATE